MPDMTIFKNYILVKIDFAFSMVSFVVWFVCVLVRVCVCLCMCVCLCVCVLVCVLVCKMLGIKMFHRLNECFVVGEGSERCLQCSNDG